MVKHASRDLDAVFAALADPTRRAILARLRRGTSSVSLLAAPFPVSLPAICDADTGFGDVLHVRRTVQEFERAGIAGIHIEDQEMPKRCGHLAGKHLVEPEAMAQKIAAAVDARRDPDFLIVARVDARSVYGLENAIARARLLLEELGIASLARQPAYTLSGGERRRLEICRALAASPAFILLDEPFAGIDPMARADLQRVIAHLKGRGIGVLITDHNVRETLKIADRAYILKEGEVFRSGTPTELASDEEVRKVYLGESFQL